jgi:hypothetical protein
MATPTGLIEALDQQRETPRHFTRSKTGRSLCGVYEGVDEQSFLFRSDDAPCNYHYPALNHCWGGEQPFRLLKSNMKRPRAQHTLVIAMEAPGFNKRDSLV